MIDVEHDKQLTREHDKQITILSLTMEEIKKTSDKIADKLDTMVDSVNKQKVLFEKIVNLDSKMASRFKRVHERFDSHEIEIGKIKHIQSEGGCTPDKISFEKERSREIKFNNKFEVIDKSIAELKTQTNKINSDILQENRDFRKMIISRVVIVFSAIIVTVVGFYLKKG